MAEGNGVDLGSIYGLLREVAAAVSRHDARFDQIEARLDRIEARLDRVEADLAAVRAELKGELGDLRQTLADYHGAVMGHGIHISEHDECLTRLERQLNLPAT